MKKKFRDLSNMKGLNRNYENFYDGPIMISKEKYNDYKENKNISEIIHNIAYLQDKLIFTMDKKYKLEGKNGEIVTLPYAELVAPYDEKTIKIFEDTKETTIYYLVSKNPDSDNYTLYEVIVDPFNESYAHDMEIDESDRMMSVIPNNKKETKI